jgi:hypothetical protein
MVVYSVDMPSDDPAREYTQHHSEDRGCGRELRYWALLRAALVVVSGGAI